jgi:hypothetical protein
MTTSARPVYVEEEEGLLYTSKEEEEGLHGVFKRLRRNGHQLKRRRRGVTRCVQAATPQRTPAEKKRKEEGLHGVFKRLRRNGHQLKKKRISYTPPILGGGSRAS